MATAILPSEPQATTDVTPESSSGLAVAPASLPTPPSGLTLYRMPYDLYARIAEVGLLGSKDRVVLLDGLLVNQMTIGPRHSTAVALSQVAIQSVLPAGWYTRSEQPIVLRGGPRGDSAPQPDLIVALGSILRYAERHPEFPEIGLVVEVATDTDALRVDRAALSRYAHAGIPTACIVNIPDRVIELYTDPSGPIAAASYRSVATLRPGQSLVVEIGNDTTGRSAIAPIPVESFFAPI